ncbi:MAG: hypothetical protein KC800_26025 [Candidatus Eremiobacteraeota bacterium]|nr:hypothetical protein [Candidatus Eremiobacteraeota bacterium]
MKKFFQPQTHWAYWASGALLSLGTIGACNMDVPQCGAMGIVTLLFCWGALSSEQAEIRALRN